LRINGRTRIVVFGAAGIVILLAVCVALFPERRPTYEVVLTSYSSIDHPPVLNVETGEMIPIETAILHRVPYIGVMYIGKQQTRGSLWTALISPEYTYSMCLLVSGVDLEFAPAKAGGRLLHDYWADEDAGKWPAIPPRQTSSYVWTVEPNDQDRRILLRTFGGTTGVLRVTVKDESNADLRCRIVAKAPSGTRPARRGDAPGVARWPEGPTVELVAISRHPSAASGWWAPDGSLLARPPCLTQTRVLADQNDPIAYQVAYRFLHLDREYVHGTQARAPESPGMTPVPAKDEFGGPCQDCGVRAFLCRAEAETAVLDFGFATGQWQTILAVPNGGEMGSDDLHIVRISPPEEVTGVALTLTLSRAWTDNYAWRFQAVGHDGGHIETRMASRGGDRSEPSSLEQYSFTIDCRLSDIKEFRFNVCRYHWLRFQNVSLRPGQDFGVRIEPLAPQAPLPPGEAGS
jgi:hypothetical protein